LKRFYGFLGIIGYYMEFVKNHGKIVATLTSFLKNNLFVWSEAIEQYFFTLKDAMCTTSILTVLYLLKKNSSNVMPWVEVYM
jgi:hypothetical protein